MGLLLKVNFSQEKLSLYSLMLVLDTMGTSSPEIVPAVWGKEFVFSTLTFLGVSPTCRAGAELAATYYYESINGFIKPRKAHR